MMAEGRHPSQIVLRQIKPRTYATHIKVSPCESELYFILGHYFFNLKEAEDDFHKRILKLEGPQPGKRLSLRILLHWRVNGCGKPMNFILLVIHGVYFANSSFFDLIDANNRVHGNIGSLDARELGPEPLLGRINNDCILFSEKKTVHFNETENRAMPHSLGIDFVNPALIGEYHFENTFFLSHRLLILIYFALDIYHLVLRSDSHSKLQPKRYSQVSNQFERNLL